MIYVWFGHLCNGPAVVAGVHIAGAPHLGQHLQSITINNSNNQQQQQSTTPAINNNQQQQSTIIIVQPSQW